MIKQNQIRFAVVAMCWLLPFAWLSTVPPAHAKDAPQTAETKIPPCLTCDNKGAQTCRTCKGRGFILDAIIKCPDCKGEQTLQCPKCKGKKVIDCKTCKKRKVDDEKIFAQTNPEYKKWKKKYSSKMGFGLTPAQMKAKGIPKPPEKYIKCTVCDGEGTVECDRCKGEGTIDCKRCKGVGTLKARGVCPTCKGEKREVCSECSILEGFDESAAHKTLQVLLTSAFINKDEYFLRRRQLVWRQKQLNKTLGKAAKFAESVNTEDIVDEVFTEKNIAATGIKNDNWDKHKKDLALLMGGYAGRTLSLKQYGELLRELSLPEALREKAERVLGEKNERMKKLSVVRENFRTGKFDLTQYNAALENL